jgi:hypothetical protein
MRKMLNAKVGSNPKHHQNQTGKQSKLVSCNGLRRMANLSQGENATSSPRSDLTTGMDAMTLERDLPTIHKATDYPTEIVLTSDGTAAIATLSVHGA